MRVRHVSLLRGCRNYETYEKVIWCENDKDPLTFTGLAEARTPERKVRNCHMTTPTPENCPDLPEPLAV